LRREIAKGAMVGASSHRIIDYAAFVTDLVLLNSEWAVIRIGGKIPYLFSVKQIITLVL